MKSEVRHYLGHTLKHMKPLKRSARQFKTLAALPTSVARQNLKSLVKMPLTFLINYLATSFPRKMEELV
jgi:hypothetical protein